MARIRHQRQTNADREVGANGSDKSVRTNTLEATRRGQPVGAGAAVRQSLAAVDTFEEDFESDTRGWKK